MSEYNVILELGMQNGLPFPVFFACFVQHVPLLSVWETWSLFCLWGGNAWTPDFSIHDCPCTRNALSACALTSAILSPVRVGLAIPTHGDDSCDFSCSVARVKILPHMRKGYLRRVLILLCSLELNGLKHPKMLRN